MEKGIYSKYLTTNTAYIKNSCYISPEDFDRQKLKLNEIFISGIPVTMSVDQLAMIALMFGEIHQLRFKLRANGKSRGIAFLQYTIERDVPAVVKKLTEKFTELHFRTIKVAQSINKRSFTLRNVASYHPLAVYQVLWCAFKFEKIVCYHKSDFADYELHFQCNNVAVRYYNTLTELLPVFGPNAYLLWTEVEQTCSKCDA